jgi:anti-sigma factor ChrR (cupin superfamily)
MIESINGNLSSVVAVDTESMPWTPSPSCTVWRRRVHLVGPPESGQVTSIVRYEPGATFPKHDHPNGEEILVLEGVFSDEHGDWPAGTYLLNPEGFRHAPFSRDGCVLFVKLRQFPGRDRIHVAIQTGDLAWSPTNEPGVASKQLYEQAGFADSMHLARWAANADRGQTAYEKGAELFVINGEFSDESGRHRQGAWLRFPVGGSHVPSTQTGCTLFVKLGGLGYLRSAGSLP